jgi:hypothetical protein
MFVSCWCDLELLYSILKYLGFHLLQATTARGSFVQVPGGKVIGKQVVVVKLYPELSI